MKNIEKNNGLHIPGKNGAVRLATFKATEKPAKASPSQDESKVVSSPQRSMNLKDAMEWVVKEHSEAWKRLADR